MGERKRKMKSIGIKLTSIMLGIILAGIVITVGVAAIMSRNVIMSESLAKIQQNTQLEEIKLDNWLMDQLSGMNALNAILSSDEELAVILLADQTGATSNLEDQVASLLRPTLKAVLDENSEQFEVYMGFLDGSALTGSGFKFNYATWTSYERGWYKTALTDTTRPHITSPYVDAQTGLLCITAAQAVTYNGRLIGVIGADIYITELQDITLSATLDSKGYAMLVNETGDILIHPDADYAPDAEGNFKNLGTIMNGTYSNLWKEASAGDGTFIYKDATGTDKYYNAAALPSTGWHMITVIPVKVVTQPITSLIWTVVPISVGILIIAAVMIFITIRNIITRPVSALSAFMKKAGSTGDLAFSTEEAEIIGKFSKIEDEIGQAINGSSLFITHVTKTARSLEAVANGDLTANIEVLSEYDTLGTSLQKMEDSLNEMFGEIQSSSSQVSHGSKQVADGAQALAQGATEQAASIEELSSSIAEIAERTKTNTATAEKTSKLSEAIIESAEKGSRQMDEMIMAVNDINEASKGISKIIKTIDDIAFQTNILALNAAVEAARAGQHGKGFAVVAEEVRNLASKSAEAAKDTGGMIQNSMDKAELGSRIAGETAASLNEIVNGINESSLLVTDIAKSSGEQTLAITQVNVGIDQVAQVVQQNSATAQQSAAASEEMSSQSDMLQQLIAQFKLKDGDAAGYRGLGIGAGSSRAQKRLPTPERRAARLPDSNSDFGKY